MVSTKADVRVRRVYDKAEDQDGVRVLVDHIWPRGVSNVNAGRKLTPHCRLKTDPLSVFWMVT